MATFKTGPCDHWWSPCGPVSAPIHWVGEKLEAPAKGVVGDAINTFADDCWNFASWLLKTVFHLLDGVSKPVIVYTPGGTGPIDNVYPICIFVGLFLTILFAYLQLAEAMLTGVKALAYLLRGIAVWMVAWGCALELLTTVNTGATGIAEGIIQSSFKVHSWQGMASTDSFLTSSVHGLTGVGLAIFSCLLVIPFGFALLGEMLIRQAGMEILAATFPIIIAGVVWQRTARWFFTGLRWMLALICMLPLIALSMAIGHSIAVSSVTGGATAQIAQAMVSAVVNDMSLLWPLALFKLFAFVDPNTVAGANFKSSMGKMLGGGSDSGGGEDTEGGKADAEGTSDSGAGGSGSDSGPSGTADKTSEATGSEGGNPMERLSAMGAAMQSATGSDKSAEQGDHAAQSMDGVGAGHAGGGGTPGSEDEDQQDSEDSEDDSNDSTGSGGDSSDGDNPGDGGDVPVTPGDAQSANEDAISGANPTDDMNTSPGSDSGQGQDGGDGSGNDDSGGGQGGTPGGGNGPGGGAGGGEAAGAEEAAVVVA